MVSQATEREVYARLTDPALGLGPQERQQLVDDYLRYTYRVRVDALPGGPSSSELPGFDAVRLALAGRAHALITSDPDLLALSGQLACPIVSLGAFLQSLEATGAKRSRRSTQPSAASTVSQSGAVSM